LKYENLNDIAEALLNLKYDLIVINLVIVCLAVVAVYFVSRIKKSAELKEINNNFSTVLKQQSELAEETGKIKQSLEKESISYQIKLNAYHEKSIEAINDIYISIINLRDAAKELGFNQSDEKKQKFVRSVTEFRNIFDTRKIWIPHDLSVHIEGVAIEIDNRSHKFIIANTLEERIEKLSEERVNQIFDEQDKFYDYIHKEIAVVFDELVEKISKTVSTKNA